MASRRYKSIGADDAIGENNDSHTTSTTTTEQLYQNELFMSQQQQKLLPLNRYKINELVMNYLVHQDFKDVAESFRLEAGIETKVETKTMKGRIQIRKLIENGDMLQAQFLINSYYPELFDNHRDTFLRLQQQHMVELIRAQKLTEVLDYVHNHLNVDELTDLGEIRRTLALLAYENPENSPYSDQLKTFNRLKLASEINDIILQETSGQVELTKPSLVTLVKLIFWTQNELDKKKIQYQKLSEVFKSTETFKGLSNNRNNQRQY